MSIGNYVFLKSLSWAVYVMLAVHGEGNMWHMEKRTLSQQVFKIPLPFCRIPKPRPKAMMCLLESRVHSKAQMLKNGFSAPLCKAAHCSTLLELLW